MEKKKILKVLAKTIITLLIGLILFIIFRYLPYTFLILIVLVAAVYNFMEFYNIEKLQEEKRKLKAVKEMYVKHKHVYQKQWLDELESNREKDKEIQKYKNMYQAEHDIHLVRNEQLERKERGLQSLQKQLLEKDKIINLMAEFIEKVTVDMKIAFGENMLWDRNEIKQHFENLAKETH